MKFKERKKKYLKGRSEFWDGGWRLQPPETAVGWADQAAGGAEGSGGDVGLWRLRLGGVVRG